MTKEQIEKKAKEIANKYAALGFKSGFARERYEAATEMAEWLLSHQWVSVEDELPPQMSKKDHISDRVIVHTSSDCVFVDHYDHYSQEWIRAKGTNYATGRVTHWMPIPPLAEEGGEK